MYEDAETPLPSADQETPFHLAILFTNISVVSLRADSKLPPTYNDPFESKASACTEDIVPTGNVNPLANAEKGMGGGPIEKRKSAVPVTPLDCFVSTDVGKSDASEKP